MSEVWSLTKIGDCCDILDNLRVPLNAEEREGMQGDIPYYGANGLQGYIDNFIFDEPLILLAEDGGYFDEYETRPIAYRISGKSWVNNHAHILRVKAGYPFCQDFIFYSLQHKNITPFIKGGTRAKLNQRELREILIPTPPRALQRHIAEILSTLDEAIEQTEALIAKMQKVKAGLMHDLFTRGVTPDGRLRPTREQAPELYKESPIGWIPKEWEVVTIEECAAKVPGATTIGPFGSNLVSSDYRSEGVPVVFVRDVKEDAFEWNSNVYVTSQKAQQLGAHAVRPGDLVSTKMGLPPCITCAYPEWMEEGVITADIIRLRPDNSKVYTRWLSVALNSDVFKRQVQAITAGVTRPKVTLSEFRKLRLPCPGIQEQESVATRFEALAEILTSEAEKLSKLQKEKHGLMHDLLTGRVRVGQTEIILQNLAGPRAQEG